jgi:hypothetical protein
MKIIGSKRAAELAREEFGKKAYVLRTGKTFEVGWFWGTFRRIKGEGRSWSEALRNAGVEIPNETNCANVPTPADVEKLAGGGE